MSCQAALALASPMYDHPRHLKAKRIGHVLIAAQNALHMYFSLTSCVPAKRQVCMYVCMYVCMCVDETKQLTEEIRRHLMDPVDGRSKRCSRGGDEQGALLWHSGYV